MKINMKFKVQTPMKHTCSIEMVSTLARKHCSVTNGFTTSLTALKQGFQSVIYSYDLSIFFKDE